MSVYTIETFNYDSDVNPYLEHFFVETAAHIANLYGNKFDWRKFKIFKYADRHRIRICYKDGRPVGVMLARLCESIFDSSVRVLIQDLLYAQPGTRASKLLLDDFIDFGRCNANHIITMISEHTNIKEQSLVRLGFQKLETFYRIEVERG